MARPCHTRPARGLAARNKRARCVSLRWPRHLTSLVCHPSGWYVLGYRSDHHFGDWYDRLRDFPGKNLALESTTFCFDSSCRQYWKAEMLKAKMAKDVAQGKQGVIARCDRLRKGCSHLIGPSSREGRETPVPEAPLVAVTKIKS